MLEESESKPVRSFPARHRRRDIQGLRGVAVLLVVLFHSTLFVDGGFIGVDVFFVISGYVITSSLQREWIADGGVSLRDFYARRVKRLLPALSLTTAVTVLVAVLVQSPNGPQQQTAKTAFGVTAAVANFVLLKSVGDYFTPTAEDNPLLHTWSLSAEEQFFLVFPAVLVGGWTIGRHFRVGGVSPAVWLVAVGLAIPSILLSLATSYDRIAIPAFGGSPRLFAFYSSATRAWEFGLGALLVLMASRIARLPVKVGQMLGIAGCVLVLGSALFVSDSEVFPGLVVLVPVLGASAIIASGQVPGAGLHLLESPALVWIGDLSYSWYLWHWPTLVFTRNHLSNTSWAMVTAAVISLIPAYLSFRYVETPFRRSPRIRGRRVLVLALAALALSGLSATVLAVGSRYGWGMDWPIGSHVAVRNGCDHGEFDPARCKWGVEEEEGVVLLAGDSQAWAVADGLISGASQLGFSTTVASRNGCPFFIPDVEDGNRVDEGRCSRFRHEVLDYALDTRPVAVVVSNWSMGYVHNPGYLDRWIAGLTNLVEPLEDAGIPVIVLSSYPVGDKEARARSLLIRPDRNRSTAADNPSKLGSWLVEAEREFAEGRVSVAHFDTYPVLCDQEVCHRAVDGVEYYSDENHLSRAGSMLLSQPFVELLESVSS